MANGRSLEDDLQYQTLVWNHMLAVVDTMVLKCAIKLRLFDAVHRHVGGHPITLRELATSLPVPHERIPVLRRLMRYLAHMRLVHVHEEELYTLTAAAAAYLRDGSENCHASYVRFFMEEDMLAAMHGLDAFLVGGNEDGRSSAVAMVRGENVFGLAAKDPGLNGRANEGMVNTVRPIIEAVLKGCPEVFENVRVLVDVGGGMGVAAAVVARAFSGVKCVVYDLPHVVKEALESELVEFESGDMLVSVPRADALMFMRVLHDYDDKKVLQILKNCREAITEENGKVIIIDTIINENDAEKLYHVKIAYDILMMSFAGGKERTEKEFRSLLLKAGFTRCNIKSVMALQNVIEARP